jgi:hypothetical protein
MNHISPAGEGMQPGPGLQVFPYSTPDMDLVSAVAQLTMIGRTPFTSYVQAAPPHPRVPTATPPGSCMKPHVQGANNRRIWHCKHALSSETKEHACGM